jgi:hypothetical protein
MYSALLVPKTGYALLSGKVKSVLPGKTKSAENLYA